MWTVEKVKADLPSVKVRFFSGGIPIVIDAVVRGRKQPFATVTPFEFGSSTSWEFAWETIARSLNLDCPLKV